MSSSATYPDALFQRDFVPPPEHNVSRLNKPGARPGAQGELDPKPVDDVYADGRPYVGSGKLEGKVALVTGGDSGIGRATVILFALEGADSAIVYLPAEQADAESVRDYVAEKTGGKRRVHLLPRDLKDERANIEVVEETVKALGRLDVLVLNSAQQLESHDLASLPTAQWLDCFAVNVHSPFWLCRAAVPHMPPGGSIIAMDSINAFIGRPDLLEYTATKGALLAFVRGLSNQILAKTQIRVNAIAPGPVWTPLVPSTFSAENVEGTKGTPMGRPGQPVEVATVCVFLASADSSFISGNTIHPNGGVVIS